MQFISGNNRQQVTFSSLEDLISTDNPVRLVDAFVEHIDLVPINFKISSLNKEGRPAPGLVTKATRNKRTYIWNY